MSERVRIGQAANPAEATLVRSLFDAHGIAVAINGEQHAAMLGGLGGGFISLDITVDSDDAERARDLLAELQAQPAERDDPDDHDDDDGDDVTLRLERRKRIGIAVMLAVFISFGTAHLSAGAYKRALALAICQIIAIRELVVATGPLPAICFAAVVLFDLIDAIRIINHKFALRIPVARVRK